MSATVVIGQRTSELPYDVESPAPEDFIAFVDVSAGRDERTTIDKLANSTAFSDRGTVLIWDGGAYAPAAYLVGSQPKEFRGPVDPSTIPGVTLGLYDTWINTA